MIFIEVKLFHTGFLKFYNMPIKSYNLGKHDDIIAYEIFFL